MCQTASECGKGLNWIKFLLKSQNWSIANFTADAIFFKLRPKWLQHGRKFSWKLLPSLFLMNVLFMVITFRRNLYWICFLVYPILKMLYQTSILINPFPNKIQMYIPCLYNRQPSPGSSVGNDAGCQSGGCEFESRLDQLSFRGLTKVIATWVIHLPPMG